MVVLGGVCSGSLSGGGEKIEAAWKLSVQTPVLSVLNITFEGFLVVFVLDSFNRF